MIASAAPARALSILPAGVRFMLASAFFFSLMSLLVKVAGRGLPSQEIVLVRGVVTLVLSYWMVKRARIYPWGNRRWILVLRGLLGFAALSCFYFALILQIASQSCDSNLLWASILVAAAGLWTKASFIILLPLLLNVLQV